MRLLTSQHLFYSPIVDKNYSGASKRHSDRAAKDRHIGGAKRIFDVPSSLLCDDIIGPHCYPLILNRPLIRFRGLEQVRIHTDIGIASSAMELNSIKIGPICRMLDCKQKIVIEMGH